MADFLKVSRPDFNVGFDGGFDLVWNGLKWDVKVLPINGRFDDKVHVFNVFYSQVRDFSPDGYFFLSYDKRDGFFEVGGWILKKDFLAKAKFFPAGSVRFKPNGESFSVIGGNYEIKRCDLNVLC